MAKAIKTNLKLVREFDIYADGSGAPNEAFVELYPGKKTFYVRAGELYRLRENPNEDAPIKKVYTYVETRGDSILLERVPMNKQELTDFCDFVLHSDKFGCR